MTNHIIKKVAIKEVWGHFRTPEFIIHEQGKRQHKTIGIVSYNFEKLKREVKEQGIKTLIQCVKMGSNPFNTTGDYAEFVKKELTYLTVHREFKYSVADGNHRMYVLRELYGEEYELEVSLTSSLAINTN